MGDIYLIGRLPLSAVSEDEVDALLGQVLHAADSSFNTLLEMGFATAIRAEWDRRLSHGEPTDNLAAFEHLRPSASDILGGTDAAPRCLIHGRRRGPRAGAPSCGRS